MGRGREPGHVDPDLGDDHPGGDRPDAGDLIQPGGRLSERGDQVLDSVLDGGDVGVDRIHVGQHPRQQKRVVFGEPALERLPQRGDLLPHPGTCQLGQDQRIAFPGDQGGHHRPPRDAEDVGGDHRHLDAGVFQQLLHPVLLPAPLPDQVDPVPGQVPQPTDRLRRHETRPQHLPFGDLALDKLSQFGDSVLAALAGPLAVAPRRAGRS